MTRRLLLLLITLAVALGAPGGASADDGDGRDGNNIAEAVNTKDGSSLFKFAFQLRKVSGEVVDNGNAAIAYSSCKDCRTTAIAIQIVLVVGSPTTVKPENVAIAINDNCTLCQSFATAFQFVIGVKDDTVGLTKEGKRELRQIIREFRALKKDDYTLEEFHARTQALGQQLREVLNTQLQPRPGESEQGDQVEGVTDEDVRPAPPAAPTTTSTEETTAPSTTTETATDTATTQTTTSTVPPPATTTEPATTTTAP